MKSGRIEFPRVYEDVLDRLAVHWHFVSVWCDGWVGARRSLLEQVDSLPLSWRCGGCTRSCCRATHRLAHVARVLWS